MRYPFCFRRLSDRLSITITILLTLVAYRFAIMDRLPNVDHLVRLTAAPARGRDI
jgi:hypothetical protein